jgi:hypothetical protein
MMFCAPCRYLQFRPKDRVAWDEAIEQADAEYSQKCHIMGFGSDCHSHVCRALNLYALGGCSLHNKVALAAQMFFCGTFIGARGFVVSALPFLVISLFALITRP